MSTTWNDSRFGPGSYEHAAQEDRSTPRVRVHISAHLRPAGMRTFAAIVRDLSLGGCTVVCPTRIDERTMCWLTLPEGEAIKGEVVWWDAGLLGLAFATLLDQTRFAQIIDSDRF